jgi:hypothetical protein
MRDRQARGQDPYHSGDVSDEGDFKDAAAKLRLGNGRVEKEDFFRVERRQKAIAFLDNPELLMMYAQSTGDVSVLCMSRELAGWYADGRQERRWGASSLDKSTLWLRR